MTKEDLILLKEDIEQKYKEQLTTYLQLIKQWKPHLLEPKEIVKQKMKDKLLKIHDIAIDDYDMLEHFYPEYFDDTIDYSNPLTAEYFPSYQLLDNNLSDYKLSETDLEWLKNFCRMVDTGRLLISALTDKSYLIDDYTDSPIVYFNNEDIIITDPCYLTKDNDWQLKDYREVFTENNIKFITHSTIYGDWSCMVFNKETGKPIGRFTADAGFVGVFSLKEVKQYNEAFDDFKNKFNCIAYINNFTGSAQIKVKQKNYSFSCYVEGIGNINFISKQTGF